jgi:hypothetical protein
MAKKKSLTVIKQNHGVAMTDEGLLIPGRLLREMGEAIAVSFSPQLIIISLRPASSPTRKPKRADRRSPTEGNGVKREPSNGRRKT